MTVQRPEIPSSAPPEAPRPKFWSYYRARGLTPSQIGEIFQRSAEWVRLIGLPFGDPKRRVPDAADVERIFLWSNGEVGPADWYPPHLSSPTSARLADARSDQAVAS